MRGRIGASAFILIQTFIILSSYDTGPNFLEQDAKDGPVDSRVTVNSGEKTFKSTLSATTNLPQLIEAVTSGINGTSLTVAPGRSCRQALQLPWNRLQSL